ncbi:hypothetical protein BH09SUM1_BH09SUM1_10130 [soil metagenome]
MGTLPYITFVVALFSPLLYFAGAPSMVVVPFVLAAVLGIAGMIFGDKAKPVSSRVASLLAIVLAACPLAIPYAQSVRLGILEKRRAEVTKPIYEKMDADFEAVKPKIADYYKTYHVMPEFSALDLVGHVDEQGVYQKAPDVKLAAGEDPFSPIHNPLRWAAVRDSGVVIVSAGQDGEREMPLPGVLMDGPPANPLTGFAMTGVDPRTVTYDPTNGALGLGDVVHYYGRKPYEETFKPLFDGWTKADKLSPYAPTIKDNAADKDHDPQSARDNEGAEKLLAEKDYIGALALASRGLRVRDPLPIQWSPGDSRLDFTRGLALYHLGAFREAADAFGDYTVNTPNDASGHFYRAAALFFGRADRNQTLMHLSAAMQIDAQNPDAALAAACYDAVRQGSTTPPFPPPAVLQAK